jgi:hypothetical protein
MIIPSILMISELPVSPLEKTSSRICPRFSICLCPSPHPARVPSAHTRLTPVCCTSPQASSSSFSCGLRYAGSSSSGFIPSKLKVSSLVARVLGSRGVFFDREASHAAWKATTAPMPTESDPRSGTEMARRIRSRFCKSPALKGESCWSSVWISAISYVQGVLPANCPLRRHCDGHNDHISQNLRHVYAWLRELAQSHRHPIEKEREQERARDSERKETRSKTPRVNLTASFSDFFNLMQVLNLRSCSPGINLFPLRPQGRPFTVCLEYRWWGGVVQ